MPPRKRPFVWDPRTANYRGPRGRFVSRAAVRTEIDRHIVKSTARVNALGARLRAGEITLRSWTVQTRRELKNLHGLAAMAAKGGRAQMSPGDWGRTGQLLKEQYARLDRFAASIDNGLPLDGRFTRRVQMYAEASRSTFHEIERAEMNIRQFDEERNLLAPADHCRECVTLTMRSWVPIGTLPQVGTRECLTNCKCRIQYRNSRTGQVAA